VDISELESNIGKVQDYPKPGILFYDISPLLNNPKAFNYAINIMAEKLQGYDINKVAAIDARGFIFGSALAIKLKMGLVMIRKKNKLPGKTITQNYKLEYGEDDLEIQYDLSNGKFAIIDDVLATGGTAVAACNLIKNGGGTIGCYCTLIELEFLFGRKKIKTPFETIIQY
tara:strand:+ start:18 stop:530 length:513 start_codon:yes stop_codon:yes gene_type:complete